MMEINKGKINFGADINFELNKAVVGTAYKGTQPSLEIKPIYLLHAIQDLNINLWVARIKRRLYLK